MPFFLRDVGLDCFTLVYRGEDIGAVFSTDDGHARSWVVVLQERRFRSGRDFPPPFTCTCHYFAALRELREWLGVPMPETNPAGAVT